MLIKIFNIFTLTYTDLSLQKVVNIYLLYCKILFIKINFKAVFTYHLNSFINKHNYIFITSH